MIERAPAERVTRLNDFVKRFAFAFSKLNALLGAEIGTHDLQQRRAAAAHPRGQPLTDDPAQRVGQPDADLFLFLGFKHAHDTVDGLAGVDGVQRGQNQMAGFGGRHADLHGFAVAHFADQNHFRRLAQRGAKAAGKRVEVDSQLPLVERGLLLRVHILDRILKRDDVDGFVFVDFVEQGGQGRRLAGARRAGHEDKSGFFLRHILEYVRHAQVLHGRDLRVQLSQDNGVIGALREDVDAEPRFVAEGVGGVAGTCAEQVFGQSAVAADQIERNHLRLKWSQPFERRVKRHRHQLAERLHLQRFVHREIEVGHFLLGLQHLAQYEIQFGSAHGNSFRSGIVVIRRRRQELPEFLFIKTLVVRFLRGYPLHSQVLHDGIVER